MNKKKLKAMKEYCIYHIGEMVTYATVALTVVVVGGISYCVGVETGMKNRTGS